MQSRIVELCYFGGLTVEEVAEFMDISPTAVNCSWSSARIWLGRELKRGERPE
jgi:DNA-directed RNA polymerase specialized sigma24 family protein